MSGRTTPAERSALARAAALQRWAREDTRAGTRAAAAGFDERFLRLVDPDGVLPVAERAARAGRLKRAHMTRLAVRSAQARRSRKPVEDA